MMRFLLSLLVAATAWGAGFQAGVARVDITPEGPIWLSGYASRDHPSEGVLMHLYVRAVALRDPAGNRQVIVGTDLIGLPGVLSDEVCARVIKEYDLERSQILLNASHTHTGAVVWPNLKTMYDLPPEEVEKLKRYSRRVTEAIVTAIGAALGDVAPATISYGEGETGFAANRRELRANGTVDFGVSPRAPVDHSVPVIRITAPDGILRAVVFGYACHNTTLTGQHYRISGDYAGYAAASLERAYPDAVALFLELCGADQNPNPRGEIVNVQTHSESLATEVKRVMTFKLRPVRGQFRAAFQMVDLEFRYHTREQFEKELESDSKYVVWRAREMLAAYDARQPVRHVAYPVQAVRLGRGPTILALGGEVVVDYSLRAKREFPGERLIVAGYSNDVMCYIPSLRVLREGGYEADDSMIYYGQPGPFAEDVEERIFETITQVMRRVGVKR